MERSSEIKALIEKWCAAKPGRTHQVLAKKSGVKYNTIRRICIGESEPECYTAMSILEIVASPEDSAQYLEKHYPKALGLFGRFSDSKISSFSGDMNEIVKDRVSYLMVSFAYAGIATRETLVRVFGELSLITAEKLVRDGVLYWTEDDELKPSDEKQFRLFENRMSVLDACSHILDFSRMDISGSTPVAIIAAVHHEEKEQIKAIIRRALDQIAVIVKESNGGRELVTLALSLAYLAKD